MLRNVIINKIKYKILDEYNLDSIIIKADLRNNSNFLYILQETNVIFENSYIIIEKDKNILVLSDLEKKSIDLEKYKDFDIINLKDFNIKKYLLSKNRVGIDINNFSYRLINEFKEYTKIIDIGNDLLKLREIKEREEIDYIRKANEITKKVFEEIYSINLENYTEYKLKSYLEEIGREYGVYGYSFDTIVAFDKNTSKPHYIPTPNKNYAKDLILIDIGIKYKNYTADVTRFFILENSNENIKNDARFLLSLHNEILLKIEEGKKVYDLDKFYRDKLLENKYIPYHSLGHGIGIDIHELPYISIKSNEYIQNNMVFTIEPGIYKDYGLRFEDDLTIINGKLDILSNFLRDIDEIII